VQQLGRATVAATVAWVVADLVLHARIPALAPIATLIVMQQTVYATTRQALKVLAGVVVGAGLGLAAAVALGSHWWSVGLIVLVGLGLRGWRRLEPVLGATGGLQVPITAVLVLSLGEGYGGVRALLTLVGAGFGVLVSVVAPPVRTGVGEARLAALAADLAGLLRDVDAGVRGKWDLDGAQAWLRHARRLSVRLSSVREELATAQESVRWNPRSVAGHAGRRLGARMEQLDAAGAALDHAVGQARSLTRSLADLATGGDRRAVPPPPLPAELADLVDGVAEVLADYAAVLRSGRQDAVEALRDQVGAARRCGEAAAAALSRLPPSDPRTARLVGTLAQEPLRLLDELDPEGAHAAATRPRG
jgi:hypothetical protein